MTSSRSGRCLCGLKLALHYAKDNRFMSCADAQAAHPRAKVARRSLRAILCNAGAQPRAEVMIFTGLQGPGPIVGAIVPDKKEHR